MYRLSRKSDGQGDSGNMSWAVKHEKHDGVNDTKFDSRPLLGYRMRVGSEYARTMQWQDWWQTTPVTEIISDEPDKVVFKTQSGQEYIWETDSGYKTTKEYPDYNNIENENYVPGDNPI